MWLPGHIAVSFLVCLPLVVYVKEERALALAYLGTYALLPDFLHLGMLRAISHSILGLSVLLVVTLVPLVLLFRPRLALVAIAVLAASAHLLADLYIGSIWPFYPWSSEWFQLHEFNTPFDIRVEVVLFAIVLVLLIALRPLRALRDIRAYGPRARTNLVVLVLPLGAMAGLQGVYFLIVSWGPGLALFQGILLLFFGLTLVAALVALYFAWSERGS